MHHPADLLDHWSGPRVEDDRILKSLKLNHDGPGENRHVAFAKFACGDAELDEPADHRQLFVTTAPVDLQHLGRIRQPGDGQTDHPGIVSELLDHCSDQPAGDRLKTFLEEPLDGQDGAHLVSDLAEGSVEGRCQEGVLRSEIGVEGGGGNPGRLGHRLRQQNTVSPHRLPNGVDQTPIGGPGLASGRDRWHCPKDYPGRSQGPIAMLKTRDVLY